MSRIGDACRSRMERDELKNAITESLLQQGFRVDGPRILPPGNMGKGEVRRLHVLATTHRIQRSERGLARHESRLLQRIAGGDEIDPERVSPYLVEVQADSDEELLFRYASLHWSIPVSSGYGRRLRFLVLDQANSKLMGIIGLGDPVISLAARDHWIDWTRDARHERLRYVLDAFVLGAVPPYSNLLCGKLIALLAASSDVRTAFFRKYQLQRSLIMNQTHSIQPVLLTTMSALGRSSVYNRLRFPGGAFYQSVGYTAGYGDFHFSNGLYSDIVEYARTHCTPTGKAKSWGTGFRNRREVIRKVLMHLGISEEWLCHGLRREVFVVPLASGAREFLRGEEDHPRWFADSAADIFRWFRTRWLLPRSLRDHRYREFDPSTYRL